MKLTLIAPIAQQYRLGLDLHELQTLTSALITQCKDCMRNANQDDTPADVRDMWRAAAEKSAAMCMRLNADRNRSDIDMLLPKELQHAPRH